MSQKLIVVFTYGGGMRGLIATSIMDHIERQTGHHLTELIDVFAGPSTGSIINAAINIPDPYSPKNPRFYARHITRFYERQGHRIFPADKSRAFRGLIHDFNNRTMKINQLKSLLKHGHYDPSYLNLALKRLYGSAKLGDTLKSLIIPTYNIDEKHMQLAKEKDDTDESPVRTQNNFITDGGHAVWFKNIKFKGAKRVNPPIDVNLADVVMGSTAAPTYYPCHHFTGLDHEGNSHFYSGIDGSIFDNPCISYLGALRPHLPDNLDIVFIAIGTGYTHRAISKEEWNSLGSLGVVDPVNDLPLISIFFHASESALLDTFAAEAGQNLYVFNKSMLTGDSETPSTDMDDASPENIRKLKAFANVIIEENQSSFDDLCHVLVSEHDRRRTAKDRAKSWFESLFS